ncbi:TPA: hypothetical protein DDW35_05195, partial [Candidatus Sumerlaeota bacterium]|nr:hypothetical protein [Candidatus Sumerlaeota bacterium]
MSLSLNTNLFNLSTPFIWCWTTLRPGTFKRYAKTDIYRILSFAARWEFPLTDVLEDIPVRRGNLRPGLYLQRIAKYLLRDLQQGKSLSASMEKRKGLFDSAEVEMVRAGEENGCLPEMLQTL